MGVRRLITTSKGRTYLPDSPSLKNGRRPPLRGGRNGGERKGEGTMAIRPSGAVMPVAMQMEHSAGVGSPDDESIHLAALFHTRRPQAEKAHRQQFFNGDGLLEEDELVDLQELGTLSDGDLCMGRQLVANSMALANERAENEGTKKSESVVEQQRHLISEQLQHQQRSERVPNIAAEDCLGGFVPVVKAEFLPTEAVEQFLLGMNGNGYGEEVQAMAAGAASAMGEETPQGEQSEQQPKEKKQKRASSSEESRTAARSPSSEFSAPPPPPIVISPQDVDNLSITLEKNQQCACKDCGKLFNSVWYLKQHAVKHSNDRPFKCRFCMKTYKFRSNLYQHKCPERSRLLLTGEFNMVGHPYRRRAYNRTGDKHKTGGSNNNNNGDANAPLSSSSMSVNTSPIGGEIYVPNLNTFMPMEENGEGPGLLMIGEANAAMGEHLMQQQHDFVNLQQQQQSMALNGAGGYVPMPARILSPTVVDAEPLRNGLGHISADVATPLSFDSPQFVQLRNGPSSSSSSLQTTSLNGREREFPIELIEEYMRRNKHRVFSCRKCKLYFPSREYFARHLAYHDEMEEHKYCCEKCPERFQSDGALQSHHLQHAEQSPHCCLTCNGIFRSALALRRHKDNWRQCHSPPFGLQYSLAVNPIDQYSFVESDLDEIEFGTERSEAEEDQDGMEEGEEGTVPGENGTFLPNNLSRKTTRDSGYQGSDTYSPSTGSHSPNALESDDQHHLLSVTVHNAKRDQHGRFMPLKNGKGQQKNSGKRKGSEESEKTMAQREGGEGRESDMDKNNNQKQTQQLKWAETRTDGSPNIFNPK
ncbi:hypothetical protein niasHS_013192 [Heterodera schachtii]|uniref:C2H2-type domain-containing protein n=1 Tax=Heterodera schachtii TaxID=97005 RepID=A0ABD2ID33_HETSC